MSLDATPRDVIVGVEGDIRAEARAGAEDWAETVEAGDDSEVETGDGQGTVTGIKVGLWNGR